jgi:phosphoribosylanthranilate isomerase
MTKLKICGLRDAGNAIAAAEAGADFLGFNFVPGARRRVSADRGRDIVREYRRRWRGGGPLLVGLFANQPADEVNETALGAGLDLVQLCGDEPPGYWKKMRLPIIKQIKVGDGGDTEEAVAEVARRVSEVVGGGHIALLDRHVAGALGGTGRSFDWSIAARVAEHSEFLLAGGLTPDNVGRSIATVAPWGVDVSSGVETGGDKDPIRIRAFAAQVRRADDGVQEPGAD